MSLFHDLLTLIGSQIEFLANAAENIVAARSDDQIRLAVEPRGLKIDNDGARTWEALLAALRFEGQRSGRLY